ncbi:MAG: GNAT family N-acetyltransferase, partial [Pseudomonadota bacterium]
KGHGSELLKLAEIIAISENLIGLSLIVADGNKGAHKLYEKFGFTEKSRRPIIRENWATDSREWILMTKSISSRY